MLVTAQFSIYPLKVENYGDYVYRAVNIVRSFGLKVKVGETCSVTFGDLETVLKAFQKVMEELGNNLKLVFVITLSNACPPPEGEDFGKVNIV